jgi:hypothetical protein
MTTCSLWCEESLRHPHGIVVTPCFEYPMSCWIPYVLLDTSWCMRYPHGMGNLYEPGGGNAGDRRVVDVAAKQSHGTGETPWNEG